MGAQYFGYAAHTAPLAHAVAAPVAPVAAPLPVVHAVAHSVTETVKHACREGTTEHCVDNPKVIEVPVEVENKLPKTTCEAVVTSATSHAVAPAAYHAGY